MQINERFFPCLYLTSKKKDKQNEITIIAKNIAKSVDFTVGKKIPILATDTIIQETNWANTTAMEVSNIRLDALSMC